MIISHLSAERRGFDYPTWFVLVASVTRGHVVSKFGAPRKAPPKSQPINAGAAERRLHRGTAQSVEANRRTASHRIFDDD